MSPDAQPGLRPGHLLALTGALLALAALWRPWYGVTFPQELRDAITSQGTSAGDSALGQFAKALATLIPERIEVNGWQALEATDVLLCLATVAVAALVAGAAGAFGTAVRIDGTVAARWIARIGLVGVLLVARRLIDVPGPGPTSERYGLSVSVLHGAWLALAGCAAMALGGALAARAVRRPAPVAAWAPPVEPVVAEDRTPTSVAPPGA